MKNNSLWKGLNVGATLLTISRFFIMAFTSQWDTANFEMMQGERKVSHGMFSINFTLL